MPYCINCAFFIPPEPIMSINKNDFQQGWNAAIDEAVESMNKCTAIPLMTPPDHPLFQLFFILKDGVSNLKKTASLGPES